MRYMLLIYGNEENWEAVPPEEFAEILRRTDALNQELFESGELVGAYGVGDQLTAKMVRVDEGVVAVTDGPYAEAKEYLGSPRDSVPSGAPPRTLRPRAPHVSAPPTDHFLVS